MKLFSIFGTVALIMTLIFFGSPVQAEITIAGDLETNTHYVTTSTDPSTDTTEYDLSGRVNIVPSVRNEAGNLYMESTANILCNLDGTVSIDDAWGKIGTSVFDVQIGRFEGWSLFDKGVDIIIVDAPGGASRYETNAARGRMGTPGQLALHVLPNDIFGFEAGFVYGNDSYSDTYTVTETDPDTGEDVEVETDTDVSVNVVGVRPVISVTAGPVVFSAGVDYLMATPKDDDGNYEKTQVGYGAKVKATFGIATLGLNYASGTEDGKHSNDTDFVEQTTNSFGGYCDLGLGKGTLSLAAFYTTLEQEHSSYDKNHTQYFVSYSHPLPVEGAVIRFGVSGANATKESASGDIDSDALGFKVRLNYAF